MRSVADFPVRISPKLTAIPPKQTGSLGFSGHHFTSTKDLPGLPWVCSIGSWAGFPRRATDRLSNHVGRALRGFEDMQRGFPPSIRYDLISTLFQIEQSGHDHTSTASGGTRLGRPSSNGSRCPRRRVSNDGQARRRFGKPAGFWERSGRHSRCTRSRWSGVPVREWVWAGRSTAQGIVQRGAFACHQRRCNCTVLHRHDLGMAKDRRWLFQLLQLATQCMRRPPRPLSDWMFSRSVVADAPGPGGRRQAPGAEQNAKISARRIVQSRRWNRPLADLNQLHRNVGESLPDTGELQIGRSAPKWGASILPPL